MAGRWVPVVFAGALALSLPGASWAGETKVANLGLIAPMGHPVQQASERLAKLVIAVLFVVTTFPQLFGS